MTGTLDPGELCAILGPSGSGKTSLLNVLAGRIRNKGSECRVEGTITLDGLPVTAKVLRKRIAYVMQDDLLQPTQTPKEAFHFSARMRLPKVTPLTERTQLVQDMIESLGLVRCANTFIGNHMIRGISGGEKRRTSIGVELVVRPKIIFLDEPTSGLDSYAAQSVIAKLRFLASKENRNVLCTIHQPSSEAFHTFHKTLLLRFGELFFFGAIADLSSGLSAASFGCPAEYNLADHALWLINTEPDDSLSDLTLKLRSHIEVNVTATAKEALTVGEGKAQDTSTRRRQSVIFAADDTAAPGFLVQLGALALREAQGWWRNKPGLVASVVIPGVLNLIFGSIFFQVGDVYASDYDQQAHFGGITMIAIAGMFGAAQPILLTFPLDRGIFMREYATGSYGALPYFLSKMLVELPRVFLNAVIVYLVTYWMMNLQGSFILYVLTFWGSGLGAASLAVLVGCLASNAEVANQAGPALFVPQLLFAGFYIPVSQIPVVLRWIQYICSLKYAMNLFILNEFGPQTTSSWTSSDPDEEMKLTVYRQRAAVIVSSNDINPGEWWIYFVVLISIIAFFRSLAIVVLARKAAAFF